jgi:electron transport complex protein RnfA
MNFMSVLLMGLVGGNIVLTQFIDITLLRNLRKLDVAFVVGIMIIGVTFLSSLIHYGVYQWLLIPLNLTFLSFLFAVLVVAGVSQVEAWVMKRFLPKVFDQYGFYLPLVSTNVVITYVLMTAVSTSLNFIEVIATSLAVPLGFVMINLLMVIYQERLEKTSRIPKPFQGLSITLLMLAFIAMALLGLGGL